MRGVDLSKQDEHLMKKLREEAKEAVMDAETLRIRRVPLQNRSAIFGSHLSVCSCMLLLAYLLGGSSEHSTQEQSKCLYYMVCIMDTCWSCVMYSIIVYLLPSLTL